MVMRPTALSPTDPDRREFLKTSLAGSLVLLAATVLPAGCTREEEAPRGLLVFTPGECLTMEAVAARIIPRGGVFAAGAGDVGVARRADRILVHLEADTQRRIARALRVFEYAPLFSGHLRPFRRLSPAEQDRLLHAWHSSRRPFRAQVFDALKSLTLMAFYNSHAGHDALGIAPVPCRTAGGGRKVREAASPQGARP